MTDLTQTQTILHDLALSGLEPTDIKMRPLEMAEKAACGLTTTAEGYVIPYFNIQGQPLPFYRTKLFNQQVKYRQMKGTPNHIYFPPGFLDLVRNANYLIITEGEKKAAKACREGFPCVALGGVDSWRNRILILPKETEFAAHSYNKALIGARLPSSSWDTSGTLLMEPIAKGLDDLMNMVTRRKLTVYIIFDTDGDGTETEAGLKMEVQRAAAELGFEMRRRGIPLTRIRLAVLPSIDGLPKTGIDDLLTMVPNGSDILQALLEETSQQRSAFPQHPNMLYDLSKKLQNTKMARKDAQQLSLNIITDLDSRGMRMHSKEEDQLYYFEDATRHLIKVAFGSDNEAANNPFSKFMYKTYDISMAVDTRLMKWIATQYPAEDPIEDVRPFRVLARPVHDEDTIRLQISDGQYIKVSGDAKKPIELLSNGHDAILFEGNQVLECDAALLLQEFKKRQDEYAANKEANTNPLEMWWEDVIREVRLKDQGKVATLFSLLYYMSPWLHRWRGTQLPVELVIGEAGSGKSTLCELRLKIISGMPNLRNAPGDLKDWHASIASSGGLHVTDNIQLTDKALKQRLSDEICRLITEPDPHIEQRKYYTNTDLIRLKVDAVFVFTSVHQPFQNSDLIQRSVILHLDKLAAVVALEGDEETAADSAATQISYDSAWKDTQIARFGGREAWLSHHLFVLHKFFELVKTDWNPNYKAKHRLINLEQTFVLMAKLFGLESDWIPDFLCGQTSDVIAETDWTLEGLQAFAKLVRSSSVEDLENLGARIGAIKSMAREGKFAASDIANWAAASDDFMECQYLINSRKLGKYMQSHKAMIAQITGIQEEGTRANKTIYKVKQLNTAPPKNS